MEKKVKKLIGYTPMKHQADVHRLLKEYPNGVTISVLSRRQVGKTLMVSNILLSYAINKPNSKSIYIAPSFTLCRETQDVIKKAIIDSGCLISSNESTKKMKFTNNSVIQFFSAEQGNKIRGQNVSGILVYDEAAFISDDIYNITTSLRDVHKAPVLMVSTPMQKAGRFYECFERGLMNLPGYKSIDWKNYDLSRFLSKELLLQYKLSLPQNVFKTEYLGEFIDGDSVVFESYLGCVYKDSIVNLKPKFVGIDWATSVGVDFTVVTYMDANKRVLYQTKHKESSAPLIVDAVIAELNMHNNLQIISESTGIGRIYEGFVIQRLKNGNRLEGFETSNTSKRDLIEQLIVGFQNGDLKIPDDDELLKELELFGCTYNPKTQTVKYGATVGNDDRVMSLALCYHKSKLNKGNYVVLVN